MSKCSNGHVNAGHGYREVYVDGKKCLEHRYVIEQLLNRKLESTEIIHHINGDKLDNRPENLEVTDRSEHMAHHATETWVEMKRLIDLGRRAEAAGFK